MRKPGPKILVPLTLAAAAGVVAFVIWKQDQASVTERIGFQDADEPLAMPADGDPDPRLHLLSAWETAQVPRALHFQRPLGELSTGTLGDPIFAAGDGLAIQAGDHPDLPGKVVMLAHRDRDGNPLRTIYGGLRETSVAAGDLVPRGAAVGTLGSGGFHFEMRNTWSHGLGDTPDRLDPEPLFEENLPPSPLAVALEPAAEPWTTLEIRNAERLSELEDEPERD